ncbi:MAG: glycosyl transferase, partial [Acidobacteriota bacterium]|nr:glycosyl transferase [Acidobacteriota bacterium]
MDFFNVRVRKSRAERPTLLFYCQHSLGMGHLVRSLALAGGLSESFRVVLLNGGPLPKGIRVPEGIEVIDLPPLGFDASGELVSRDGRRTVERAKGLRRQIILETFRALRPELLLVELFPFGRKKFSGELMPLLEETQEGRVTRSRPLVVCSLRDILVGRREKQEKHDERAARLANDYFDAILVHSEPAFARLEESFHPQTPLGIPVHYTGFVLPERGIEEGARAHRRARRVIVSAGGGLVGGRLLNTAVEAHALLLRAGEAVEMEIVAGPFLPEEAWQALRRA